MSKVSNVQSPECLLLEEEGLPGLRAGSSHGGPRAPPPPRPGRPRPPPGAPRAPGPRPPAPAPPAVAMAQGRPPPGAGEPAPTGHWLERLSILKTAAGLNAKGGGSVPAEVGGRGGWDGEG